ncbi:MAG: response regulator [Okeania sp. SIO3I5]|uniref:response regulator n=1 Tax=Okeania sp. SIO3I5 TaxID=2607805 RepID=UPI0013B89CCC|nr:response regulator [Okeania sp. SIO3I5]NEQ35774.1 response regulator [Okeania sp. SIO3I5]
MSVSTIGYIKLANTLCIVSQKQVTGKLVVAHGNQEWELYFLFGHLLYASGGKHSTRRWHRAINQHCPNFKFEVNQLSNNQLWEYKFLQTAISENQITLAQAKAILGTIAKEVFFAIISQRGLTRRWHPQKHSSSQTALSLLLSRREIKEVLTSAKRVWVFLQKEGLWYINPDSAPFVRNANNLPIPENSDFFVTVNKLLNGDRTIWDIALLMKMPLGEVARNLYYFEQQGLIDFKQVEDWLAPPEKLRLVSVENRRHQATIVCIDDNHLVGNFLEKILQPWGYKVVHIQDAIRGLSLLENYQPDLIFLDLVMPKVSGYTICDFLRKTTTFKDTPIVFLSNQDGFLDRTRAKLTGANDYLCKSSSPEKVVEVVAKYVNLKNSQTSQMITFERASNLTFLPV